MVALFPEASIPMERPTTAAKIHAPKASHKVAGKCCHIIELTGLRVPMDSPMSP